MNAPAPTVEKAPRRLQLGRTRGWRIQEGAVVVARGPGRRWGNPWRVHRDDAGRTWVHRPDRPGSAIPVPAHGDWREIAVAQFRRELIAGELTVTVADVVTELAGRHLYCWCPTDQPCHGEVLLTVANHPHHNQHQHDQRDQRDQRGEHEHDRHGTSSGRPEASTDEGGLW